MSTCTCSFTATEELPAPDLRQAPQCPLRRWCGGHYDRWGRGGGQERGAPVRRRLPLRKLPHAATGSAAAVAARRGSAVAGGLGATDHRAHKPAGGLAVAANGCVGAASGLRAGPPCSEPRVAMPEKGDRGADAIRAGVDVELLLLVEPPLRCLPLAHAQPGARAASRRVSRDAPA